MNAVIILGNQLFDISHWPDEVKNKPKSTLIFMREDRDLCTHFRYHKHKIAFFIAAMRQHAAYLRQLGFTVHYETLGDSDAQSYSDALTKFIKKQRTSQLFTFEIEDRFFEKIITQTASASKVPLHFWPSPMFLTTRSEFKDYLNSTKKPFMKTFYERQRKRLRILVDSNGQPLGDRWSFDDENRKPLPKDIEIPKLAKLAVSEDLQEVFDLVDNQFPHHPGDCQTFWLPIDRSGAQKWLSHFLKNRLASFGPYEDALSERDPVLFHSVLTPFLNSGLLTPKEVIEQALAYHKKSPVALASLEGFVRQIIGWREFIRGIYQNFDERQQKSNFWLAHRGLNQKWYSGDTGIAPLDHVIKKTIRLSYAHHIERLMVLGNMMVLLEVHPQQAYSWFMEMFIDSSDWVMGPNVFGMATFSDGGIFATKPYICGSNYYRKMGGYKMAPWCEAVDGLYWTFIDKHRDYFLKNPRSSMAVRTYDKMADSKKKKLKIAAQQIRRELTVEL